MAVGSAHGLVAVVTVVAEAAERGVVMDSVVTVTETVAMAVASVMAAAKVYAEAVVTQRQPHMARSHQESGDQPTSCEPSHMDDRSHHRTTPCSYTAAARRTS